MSDQKKCANPACSCVPANKEKFCSAHCEGLKGSTEVMCDCGSGLQGRCVEVLRTCKRGGNLRFADAQPRGLAVAGCFSRIRQHVEAITYFDQFREDFAGDCHRSLKRVFHVQAGDSPA
jgi:hypothetical protein